MNTYRGVELSPVKDFYEPIMWKVSSQKCYPFRHAHPNHFPPQQRPLSNVVEEEGEFPIFYSGDTEYEIMSDGSRTPTTPRGFEFPKREHLEMPTMPVESAKPIQEEYLTSARWQPPIVAVPARRQVQLGTAIPQTPSHFVFPALEEYPAFTPPLECPPPFMFPATQNPACHAPVATVTSLLQDVLGIMNTVMSEQGRVEEESDILAELVELVAIMQDEAEALVEMVDLVEEYVEEADTAAELEEWVQDLESIRSPSPWPATPMTPMATWSSSHEREDSGVSMGDSDSGFGSSESLARSESPFTRLSQENLYQDPAIHDPSPRIVLPVRDSSTKDLLLRDPWSDQPTALKVVKTPKVVASRRPTPRKEKKRPPPSPSFRDSGLGLLSPAGQRGMPVSKSPRWI